MPPTGRLTPIVTSLVVAQAAGRRSAKADGPFPYPLTALWVLLDGVDGLRPLLFVFDLLTTGCWNEACENKTDGPFGPPLQAWCMWSCRLTLHVEFVRSMFLDFDLSSTACAFSREPTKYPRVENRSSNVRARSA